MVTPANLAPTIHPDFTLYLSKEGDSVDIKGRLDPLQPETPRKIHPLQEEASVCKTHEQVLVFLKKIKAPEFKDNLSFYHSHNRLYQAHLGTFPKGRAHECSLDKQIGFVKYKILEKEHGVRQLDTRRVFPRFIGG